MGRLKDGVFGGFSGNVGNVIGSSCRGVEYIKSAPAKMTNPRTKGQTMQRSSFIVTQNFLRTMIPIIRIGFKDFAIDGMSAFNAAKTESVYDINAGKRRSEASFIVLPSEWSGDVIETFIAFKNEDGSMVSNSDYTGSFVI